jgi:hypothetical protein
LSFSKVSGAKTVGNRIAPIFTEAAVGNPNANRGLAAFVLVDFDQTGHFIDIGF